VIALHAHSVWMPDRSRAATIAPVGRSAPVGHAISDGVRFSSVLLKEEET
jgi:hypothetical protein